MDLESDALVRVMKHQPSILQQMLATVLNIIMFEDCRNQWSMSRPLLPLILLNNEVNFLFAWNLGKGSVFEFVYEYILLKYWKKKCDYNAKVYGRNFPNYFSHFHSILDNWGNRLSVNKHQTSKEQWPSGLIVWWRALSQTSLLRIGTSKFCPRVIFFSTW